MKIVKPIPLGLKVVAYLFMLNGLTALIQMAIDLFVHRSCCNLTSLIAAIVGLSIGQGLLSLSSFWLISALLFLGLKLAVVGIQLGAVLLGHASLLAQPMLGLLGLIEIPVSQDIGLGLTILYVLLNLWQVWVLLRQETRSLFSRKPSDTPSQSMQA